MKVRAREGKIETKLLMHQAILINLLRMQQIIIKLITPDPSNCKILTLEIQQIPVQLKSEFHILPRLPREEKKFI